MSVPNKKRTPSWRNRPVPDLVARLRYLVTSKEYIAAPSLYLEAASEIERLRTTLKEFRDYVSKHATQWDNGGAQHHQPIWQQVADLIAE